MVEGVACRLVRSSHLHQVAPDRPVGALTVNGHDYAIVARATGRSDADHGTAPSDVLAVLTPRELEIAMLVAAGQVNKRIAARLGISTWTVASHLNRMFCKLGVRTRAEMTARVVGRIVRT
ncbi:helix-turn-helix domain-containing protein [Methylobacterium nonmethylotrophicum]|uniref:helix-turn-helix domain-containing protein n=1 Tax=Methylobacterium nonmethylotrophicum TaxID=1141884 RepID=UPI00197C67DB|nr:helix-turn-helix transcriptional regulator [Methylobacterium nonmethylotrophicum]